MKIRPVGAELFSADGRTDMTMSIFAIRDFPQEPKKCRPRGGFETAIPAFEVSKILRALQRVVIVISIPEASGLNSFQINLQRCKNSV